MKPRLIDMLACPSCAGVFSVETWKTDGAEILDGLLHCRCGQTFPIIGGVPRILPRSLQPQLQRDYASFFADYRHRLPVCLRSAAKPKATDAEKTQKSFGFEWTKFSAMRSQWKRNFWGYMAPHSAEYLRGKTILDAGCGMGRHLYHAAEHANDVVGIDFSRAVDAAYHNTRHLPAAHVVQADLLHLPLRRRSFDFVYCLGVLHHLPHPKRALRRLMGYLRPGGEARVYVYWDLHDAPRWKRALLAAVTALRRVTTRLPHRALAWLCYPIALGAWLAFVLPYRWFSKFERTRRVARTLPLTQYAQYPFGVLLNDQFDRFSAPLERRCSSDELRGWLEQAHLETITVRPHWGWVAHGRKAARACEQSRLLTPERLARIAPGMD